MFLWAQKIYSVLKDDFSVVAPFNFCTSCLERNLFYIWMGQACWSVYCFAVLLRRLCHSAILIVWLCLFDSIISVLLQIFIVVCKICVLLVLMKLIFLLCSNSWPYDSESVALLWSFTDQPSFVMNAPSWWHLYLFWWKMCLEKSC